MSAAAGAPESAFQSPVILDLGKKKKGDIKKLCNGEGPLLDEVTACVEELKSSGAISAGAQPIVIVVRQKPSRKGMFWPLK
jgi:hypothetical protein